MDTAKKKSHQLLSASKKLIASYSTNQTEEAVIKATWNDNEIPKRKYFIVLSFLIEQAVFESHSMDTEIFLNSLDQRMEHHKWKILFKSILLVLELSSIEKLGDKALFILARRPALFSRSFEMREKNYVYHQRKKSIDTLLDYLNMKLSNFIKHGKCIANARCYEEVKVFLNASYLTQTLKKYSMDLLSELATLLKVELPRGEAQNNFAQVCKKMLATDAENIMNGLKIVLLEMLTDLDDVMSDKQYYFKLVECLEQNAIRCRKWLANQGSEDEHKGVRFEGNVGFDLGRSLQKIKEWLIELDINSAGNSDGESTKIASSDIFSFDNTAKNEGDETEGASGAYMFKQKSEEEKKGSDVFFNLSSSANKKQENFDFNFDEDDVVGREKGNEENRMSAKSSFKGEGRGGSFSEDSTENKTRRSKDSDEKSQNTADAQKNIENIFDDLNF